MILASATSLRIAWAACPLNAHVATAALVFAYAGVISIFAVNLYLTQQVVRLQHPQLTRSRPLGTALLMLVVIGAIFSLIAGIVLEFYWPGNMSAFAIHKCGATAYATIAFIPIPIVTISTLARPRQPSNEKMAQAVGNSVRDSMVAKVVIVVISATLLSVGAGYRLSTLWLNPTSGDLPIGNSWYTSRGCFYAFNFGIELFVVWFWLIMGVDESCIAPSGVNGSAVYRRSGNNATRLSINDLTRRLVVLQRARRYAQRGSRISWVSTRCSHLSAASYATWSTRPSEATSNGMDTDFDEVLMYYTDEEMSETTSDCDVNGAESDTSWESVNGQWALRPASGLLPCYMPR